MPSPSTPPDGAPTQPQLHVSDTVMARVAAYHASRVPGVLRLRPNLTQSMASITPRLFPARDDDYRMPTNGVTATVENGHAEISITLVTRWGHNCRDIAEQVQDQVAEKVRSYTGLPATVAITITDVEKRPAAGTTHDERDSHHEQDSHHDRSSHQQRAGLGTAENAMHTWTAWTVALYDYAEQVLAAQRRFAESMWVAAAPMLNVVRDITTPDTKEDKSANS
jgi:uncharacterized alkaline shock family protein YloU